MRTRSACIVFLLLFCLLGVTGQYVLAFKDSTLPALDEQWIITWGGTLDDYAYDLETDGNYMYITGRTKSFGAGGYDVFLLKYDFKGALHWNTTWGSPSDEGSWAISAYQENIYITGYQIAPDVNFNAFLLKYGSDGNLLWNVTYDSGDMDDGRDVEATNGGVFWTGESGNKAFLMKYDSDGRQQWIKTWGIPNGQVIGYRLGIENDQLYVCGYYFNFSVSRDPNLFITKFDIEGQQVWNTTWSVEGEPVPTGIALFDDGIYLTGIIKGTTGEREWDALLVKFDLLGNFQWYEIWGGPKHERAINLAIDDNNLYIIGFTRSYGSGGADVFLLEYDLSGELLYESTWGTEGNETYPNFSLIDDAFYISGMTDSMGVEGYTELSDGSTRRTYNVFLMRVTGSLDKITPMTEVESGSTEIKGIPGYFYGLIVFGLIVGVIFLLRLRYM